MIANRITVLIVDPHPVIREGLASIVSREPDLAIVAQARNGYEALELFRIHRPDLTLLDLSLPDISGVEVISRLLPEFPKSRFAVLSVFDGNEDIYRALRAGALTYLLKDSKLEELLHGIREAGSGHRYLSPNVAGKLAQRISEDDLTPREEEVIALMADGKSNRQIAQELGVSEGTIKTHVTNILEKLNVASRAHAIVEALKRGIVHAQNK
jgi:DNA-binding NarL/FixJ family response regulator